MTHGRPAGSFQTRFFFAALSSAVIAVVVAGVLFATTMRRRSDERIENTLGAEARLAAELLAAGAATSDGAQLDDEADRIGNAIGARVTFIAADGRVVGDSAAPREALATIQNQAQLTEVVDARAGGLGRARRPNDTSNVDMSYVAVPVKHPSIAIVRVALPLTNISQQLESILTATLAALTLALVGGALIAWLFAARIGERVRLITAVARRYRSGDLTPPRLGFGDDELGEVARALDDAIQEVGRRLEEQARDRGRMEAILAGMVEGVIVVDAQGKLQLVNRAARHMLKLDEPVIGRAYVQTIRHPAIAELVAAVLFGRSPEPIQLSPPRDSSRTILARAAAATGTGIHGVVLVLLDITDLRRADQIRRDFVANVSHELRTPLTAIRGYVEALTDGAASPDESRRFLEIITRHTERMERLVKDLLRLARLDAGQETLEVIVCETRKLADNVITDLASAAEQRGQRFEVTVAPGAEAVRVDPTKVHDALRNLVANAITYAPERSTIRIDAAPSANGVAITVADEGPGIPDHDLSRVFERFYRVDKSRARDPGGTGLGLAIVKHLVELHGGTVVAANGEKLGARFTMTVPAPR